ncbi:MAG: phosphate ABC transporter permease PstA [Pseudorhodoplanes sp.]|nr:phosphate ABC transporter permease PstA [Pseudorhodoplanes sp.]
MTDVAIAGRRTLDVTSDAARARIRSRYRAEARFKAYGLIAIGLTAVFLIVVLTDIVMKGIPAFTQNWLQLEVKVDPAEIDPQGTKDPAVVRSGDFALLVRNALRAQFPNVTDRAGRRQLDGLLSSGAPDVLRERVVADPALIGQTVRVPVLLSDDADLYFKGIGTRITQVPGRGTATPSGTEGNVTIRTSADDFSASLLGVKREISERARAERAEAARLRQFEGRARARVQELGPQLSAARASGNAQRIASLEGELNKATADAEGLGQKAKELEDSAAALQARFDNKSGAEELTGNLPSLLVAINGGLVKVLTVGETEVSGTVLLPLSSAAPAAPGAWDIRTFHTPESNRRVNDREVAWLEALKARGLVESRFNWQFFTSGDSREPELAGIRGALVGSALTLFVTLILCLPIGVAGAIYLEEFAPKNRLTEVIEVNINNLAAVPSIVFGLLGLAVFLNFFGLPRSAPLVGGLVLALLVLPTIIIAARAALKAVPPSIKEAALGVGASHQQAIFHHVLPLAMPGIMTGTIIGMAHALGETAPLLMIGMVAFIVEPALSVTDAATVLPVQIYLWSDLPEIAFQAKTAAAIIVLLAFLFVMNGTAIFLRRRFERRW